MPTQTEQRRMLRDAVAHFGTKQGLAKAMELSPQAVSDWCSTRRGQFVPLPRRALDFIRLHVYEKPAPVTAPWHGNRWMKRAVAQLEKLASEADTKKMKLVTDLLDSLTGHGGD